MTTRARPAAGRAASAAQGRAMVRRSMPSSALSLVQGQRPKAPEERGQNGQTPTAWPGPRPDHGPATRPCSSISGANRQPAPRTAPAAPPYQLPCPPSVARAQMAERGQHVPHRDRRQHGQAPRQDARGSGGCRFRPKGLARRDGPVRRRRPGSRKTSKQREHKRLGLPARQMRRSDRARARARLATISAVTAISDHAPCRASQRSSRPRISSAMSSSSISAIASARKASTSSACACASGTPRDCR